MVCQSPNLPPAAFTKNVTRGVFRGKLRECLAMSASLVRSAAVPRGGRVQLAGHVNQAFSLRNKPQLVGHLLRI